MTKYLKEYRDFAGGLNVDTAPALMKDNELLVADNIDLSYMGAVRKRMGVVKFNATSYNAEVERVIEWPRNDGNVVLLAVMTVAGTPKLFKVAEDGMVTEVCTLNKADIGWFFFQNKFFFNDGSQYRYYDGTVIKPVAPSSPPAPTISGPSGAGYTYYCMYTRINSIGVESLAGVSASITLDVPLGSVAITWSNLSPGSSADDTVKYRLYRTKANTSSPFYLVTEVTDGIYVDSISDTSLTTAFPNTAANISLVSRCNRLTYHPQSGRIFAAGDTGDPAVVYYSEPNAPGAFKANSKIYPSTGDGAVLALGVFGNAMLAFYPGCIWSWKGIDPITDVTWYKLPVPLGPLASRAIAYIPNALSFVGRGGIYALSPSVLMDNMVLQVGSSYMANIAEGKVTRLLEGSTPVAAIYDYVRECYLLSYRDSQNNPYVLVCWNLSRFARWSGIKVNDFCLRKNGDLLAATTNYILKFYSGYSDVDTSTGTSVGVSSTLTTKPLELDSRFRQKKIERLFIDVGTSSDVLNATVQSDLAAVDYANVDISQGGQYELPCMLKGNTFSVSISNGSSSAFDLRSIAFRYKPLHPTGKRSDA